VKKYEIEVRVGTLENTMSHIGNRSFRRIEINVFDPVMA
jgi:hypothetical protein